MIADFDNIPKAKTKRLADRYRELRLRIAKDNKECEEIRDIIAADLDTGSYASCVVYKVGKVEVSGYTRSGFIAIRARP